MGWLKNLREKNRLKKEFLVQQAEAEALRIEDLRKVSEAPRLYGFNLDEWNYIGYTEISYTDSYNTLTHSAQVFFFISKDNEDQRRYVIKCRAMKKDFQNHAWIIRNADLWAAGETEWYQPISDSPSKYTRDRILEEYNSVWSSEKRWWISNDAAKYEAAKQKQKQEQTEEEKVVSVEDNVLTVNFKKDEEHAT